MFFLARVIVCNGCYDSEKKAFYTCRDAPLANNDEYSNVSYWDDLQPRVYVRPVYQLGFCRN